MIPWRWNDHPVVQAAANFKWHPHDAAINGKAVSYARHSGGHNTYDNFVKARLDELKNDPNIINNPERAYEELLDLSNYLQGVIDANPNKKINELF